MIIDIKNKPIREALEEKFGDMSTLIESFETGEEDIVLPKGMLFSEFMRMVLEHENR